MKKIFFILFSAAAAMTCSAMAVESTPGGLAALIGENANETSLTVTGSIDASDLEFITSEMTKLESLDISGATIVAYEGAALRNGNFTSPANVMQSYALFGSSVKSIAFPASLTEIGEFALASANLESLIIPAGTAVGNRAFKDCTSLRTVDFAGATSVSDEAFAGCTALESVAGSANLVNIGNSAFKGCISLAAFTFGKNLEKIGEYSFAATALAAADLSACTKLTELSAGAFAECGSLATLKLPENLTTVGNSAVFAAKALTSLNFPNSLQVIDDYGFYGLSELAYEYTKEYSETPGVNTSLVSVGRYGLAGCSNIGQFVLPSTVEYLGDYAMANWTSLGDLFVRELSEAPTLGENVWSGVNQPEVWLYVTASNKAVFEAENQWKEFKLTESTTGSDNVVSDDLKEAKIAAWFDADVINVLADNEILNVEVYDATGLQLAAESINADNARISTSQWQTKLYIVRVTMADGTVTGVKLVRR